jgi:ribosomal protein S27E
MVIAHADHVSCPACGSPITPTIGGSNGWRIYLVRCPSCARGLVIHGSAEEPSVV